MKTLHGLLDHVMLSPDEPRLIFEGKTYALPADPMLVSRGVSWLVMARSFGFPVTLEVDDGGVIRAATVEVREHSVTFTLPSGTPVISECESGQPE